MSCVYAPQHLGIDTTGAAEAGGVIPSKRLPMIHVPSSRIARVEQVWESLVLENGIKNQLLEYATSTLLFTHKGVSKNIISWNRCAFVHLNATPTRASCRHAEPVARSHLPIGGFPHTPLSNTCSR